MSPPETTGIARAIAELGAERDRVAVRLAQIDQTITLLRELAGRTPEGPGGPQARATTTGTRSPADDEVVLLAAIHPSGRLTKPSDVFAAFAGPRSRFKRTAKQLRARGALVVTGAGRGSRWALPTKRPPAKEAP